MVSAIIVAGGRGLRMKGDVRKQYLLLDGLPILSHTLKRFDDVPDIDAIFLVVPKADFEQCKSGVIEAGDIRKPVTLVAGGARRQDSVYNGLLAAKELGGIVVIHDGVRPCVRPHDILACIEAAREHGAAILGVPVVDTLKRTDSNQRINATLDRQYIWQAQTPQAFQYDLIRRAHEAGRLEKFPATDDAQLVERMGKTVQLVRGHRNNIKITMPEDLPAAEAILKRQ
jgi:2-C-methyl-D-erythritol 4-phosphate cytidylyltransferase